MTALYEIRSTLFIQGKKGLMNTLICLFNNQMGYSFLGICTLGSEEDNNIGDWTALDCFKSYSLILLKKRCTNFLFLPQLQRGVHLLKVCNDFEIFESRCLFAIIWSRSDEKFLYGRKYIYIITITFKLLFIYIMQCTQVCIICTLVFSCSLVTIRSTDLYLCSSQSSPIFLV